jgi:pSer/pThr/pTyr-binding forkhead associated (FHA) protein
VGTLSDTTSIKRDAPTPIPARSLENISENDRSVVSGLSDGSALLLVQKGPNAGARYLLNNDVATVGRSPESEIFLDDVTVSRKHAEFRRAGKSFSVHDSGSLNGTYVNGELAESTELINGDSVQIGKYRLLFMTNGGSK